MTPEEWLNHPQRALVEKIIEYAGDRIKVAGDIIHYAEPFLITDDKFSVENEFTDDKKKQLCGWRDEICTMCCRADPSLWIHDNIQKYTEQFCEGEQIKLKDIVHDLRWALTGQKNGFSLFHSIELLGYQRTSDRIDQAIMGGYRTSDIIAFVEFTKEMGVFEKIGQLLSSGKSITEVVKETFGE